MAFHLCDSEIVDICLELAEPLRSEWLSFTKGMPYSESSLLYEYLASVHKFSPSQFRLFRSFLLTSVPRPPDEMSRFCEWISLLDVHPNDLPFLYALGYVRSVLSGFVNYLRSVDIPFETLRELVFHLVQALTEGYVYDPSLLANPQSAKDVETIVRYYDQLPAADRKQFIINCGWLYTAADPNLFETQRSAVNYNVIQTYRAITYGMSSVQMLDLYDYRYNYCDRHMRKRLLRYRHLPELLWNTMSHPLSRQYPYFLALALSSAASDRRHGLELYRTKTAWILGHLLHAFSLSIRFPFRQQLLDACGNVSFETIKQAVRNFQLSLLYALGANSADPLQMSIAFDYIHLWPDRPGLHSVAEIACYLDRLVQNLSSTRAQAT